jgi:hypothetical protein
MNPANRTTRRVHATGLALASLLALGALPLAGCARDEPVYGRASAPSNPEMISDTEEMSRRQSR